MKIIIKFILIIIFIFLIFNIIKSSYEVFKFHNIKQKLGEKIKELYLEKQELIIKKEQITKDFIIENEAKKSLGLIKQGEKIIIFKEE